MSETGKTGRFELQINAQGKADIIDWVESKEKNAICIYNDLGVLPFSSAKAVCDKLNEQDERIKELEQELQNLQTFKKILEFAEKDMEERADWQAYCEKEFEGL